MDDDVELLRRSVRGDRGAAEAFYRRHAAYVWSIVRRFSGNDDDAMDASQDAFLRVFQGAPFEGRSTVRTWLFRVASSAALDLARAGRTRRPEALGDFPEPAHEEPAADPVIRGRIAEAIAALPARLREVFILVEVMEVPHEEAAAQLGIPVGTSRRRLFDAKARLQKALVNVMREWSS